MPLYMDVHRNLNGVTSDAVAQAHLKDMEVQEKLGVCYHKYWVNETTGTVFCLVEGPNKEACDEVHRQAHGLVADDMIEVEPTLVEAFMGAEQPNLAGAAVEPGGKIDAGSRVVLFTSVANFALMANRIGDGAAMEIVRTHDEIVTEALARHKGRNVQHTGEGVMACFASASAALRFANEVQEECLAKCASVDNHPELRIGMAAGEPVEEHHSLFGVSVTTARRICDLARSGEVLVSAGVRELAVGKGFSFTDSGKVELPGLDKPVEVFKVSRVGAAVAAAVEPPIARARERPSWATSLARFGRELRRRHVHTVGIVYAGVLFILLQAAELTLEPLGLPQWTYTLLLVLGIFGFPLAIIIAWAFDVTDHGVKRTKSES